MESTTHTIGKWAWIVGVCLAVVLGIFTAALSSSVVQAVLVILGLVVGVINVRGEEAKDFLLAAVALVIVSSFGAGVFDLAIFNGSLDTILTALQYFVIPMTVVVAVKAIYSVAKDQ